MSDRHSNTKGQLFASPGVVIMKSVRMKWPQYPVDRLAEGSSVNSVINSHLPSVEETVNQSSVKETDCHLVIGSSEGLCI